MGGVNSTTLWQINCLVVQIETPIKSKRKHNETTSVFDWKRMNPHGKSNSPFPLSSKASIAFWWHVALTDYNKEGKGAVLADQILAVFSKETLLTKVQN